MLMGNTEDENTASKGEGCGSCYPLLQSFLTVICDNFVSMLYTFYCIQNWKVSATVIYVDSLVIFGVLLEIPLIKLKTRNDFCDWLTVPQGIIFHTNLVGKLGISFKSNILYELIRTANSLPLKY